MISLTRQQIPFQHFRLMPVQLIFAGSCRCSVQFRIDPKLDSITASSLDWLRRLTTHIQGSSHGREPLSSIQFSLSSRSDLDHHLTEMCVSSISVACYDRGMLETETRSELLEAQCHHSNLQERGHFRPIEFSTNHASTSAVQNIGDHHSEENVRIPWPKQASW